MAKKLTSASEVIVIAVTRLGEFPFGYMRNFEISENNNLTEERVIGNYYTQEIVNHGVSVSWSADEAVVFSQTLKERGIVLTEDRLPFSDGFVWRVVNKITGSDLCVVVDAHTQVNSVTMGAQTTIASRLSGVAIRLFDRSELG